MAARGRGQNILRDHAAAMKKAVKMGTLAGCVGSILHKGQVLYRGAYGYADLEHKTRFRHDTICRIYCSTKPYVLFVAMMLVDEGLLDLDAPVAKYLPCMRRMLVDRTSNDGPMKGPPKPAQVTMLVRHLTTHSGGLSYQMDFGYPPDEVQKRYAHIVKDLEAGRIPSLTEYIESLAKVPLCFEPGERYEYSHCMDVLGRVLEVVTGKDLAALLDEKLFRPLGMSDTLFRIPESKLPRLAAIYGGAATWGHLYALKKNLVPIVTKPGLIRLDGETPSESAWAARGGRVKVVSGGGFIAHNRGGLVSTARDTEAFVRMILDGGVTPSGQRLMHLKTLLAMEQNQLVGSMQTENPDTRWCMLGDMIKEGRTTWYQQGGAAGNYWLVDRKRNLAVISFMQQVDGDDWETLGFNPRRADIDKVARDIVDAGFGF